MGSRYEYRYGEFMSLLLCDAVPPVCVCQWMCSSVQGHSGSRTISDHHQTVLQACTGDLSTHSQRHGPQVRFLTSLCVQGIIFVYDITNQPSFQHLAKWVSDVDEVSLLWSIQPFQESESLPDVFLLFSSMLQTWCRGSWWETNVMRKSGGRWQKTKEARFETRTSD